MKLYKLINADNPDMHWRNGFGGWAHKDAAPAMLYTAKDRKELEDAGEVPANSEWMEAKS